MPDCKDQGLLLQIECEDPGKDSISPEDHSFDQLATVQQVEKSSKEEKRCAVFMCSVAAPGIDLSVLMSL